MHLVQNSINGVIANGSTAFAQCQESVAYVGDGRKERGGCGGEGEGESDQNGMFGWEQRC